MKWHKSIGLKIILLIVVVIAITTGALALLRQARNLPRGSLP